MSELTLEIVEGPGAGRRGGAIVEDLKSLNETFVNDDEIHVLTRIAVGEDILIGVMVLELRSARRRTATCGRASTGRGCS
ncbi:MAG: hypothetical protein ABR521_03605 [Gaiellaceae bacterium]